MAQESTSGRTESEKQEIQALLQQSQQAALEMMDMTPEQQTQRMQKLQDDGLQAMLIRAGFDDPELIQAVQNFQAERVQSRQPLRVTSTLIYLANGNQRDKISDAQVEALLKRYEAEVEAQRVGEKQAADDLNAKIGWSTRPRLKAWLLRAGVIGDAAWLARSNLAAGTNTELEIVQFWNANQKLPPGLAWPDVAPPTD